MTVRTQERAKQAEERRGLQALAKLSEKKMSLNKADLRKLIFRYVNWTEVSNYRLSIEWQRTFVPFGRQFMQTSEQEIQDVTE
jgi:hypothetical protein